MEIEIGKGKKGRRAYGFDDIAIVPSRRTRDPQDVDIGWKLGPHLLELPLLASAMDGVVSPEVAITLGELGGLGVISYYDSSGSNLDLKVAHCIDVACSAATSTTVDSPGTVGWYTSLAIGADGLPLVTYRDVGGTAVKVAHCPNVFCVEYLRRR